MKLIYLILLSLVPFGLFAQMGLSAKTSPRAFQNFTLNPSLTDYESRIIIGLAHINLDIYNSSGDFFESIEKKDGKNVLNVEKLISTLDADNNVVSNNELLSFYLGSKVGKLRFGLYHSFRSMNDLNYPKELVELLWYGNAPYIGQELSIGPGLDYLSFNQVGAHLAYDFGRLDIGANINALFGTAYGSTNKTVLDMTTDEEFYEIEVKTDYELISASSLLYEDPYTIRVEDDNWTDINLKENSGLSIDLGASFDITKRLKIHGYVKDLGKITFDQNVNRVFSNEEFTYSGGVFDEGVLDGGQDFQFDIDSLFDELKFESEAQSEIEVELPVNWGLGANFAWNEKTDLVFLYGQIENLRKSDNYNFVHIGVHRDILKFLRLNVNYSYKFEENNLGMGLSIHPWKFDLYFYTDNILNSLSDNSGQQTAFMTGLSMAF